MTPAARAIMAAHDRRAELARIEAERAATEKEAK